MGKCVAQSSDASTFHGCCCCCFVVVRIYKWRSASLKVLTLLHSMVVVVVVVSIVVRIYKWGSASLRVLTPPHSTLLVVVITSMGGIYNYIPKKTCF